MDRLNALLLLRWRLEWRGLRAAPERAAGLALLPEIRTIQDVAILEAILKGLETADKIEALRRIYH